MGFWLLLSTLAVAAEPQVYHPPLSGAVLHNPRMGLYLQYPTTDAQPDEWFMQLSDIAYYRLDWADVNPEPGVYTFDEYFGPLFDFWVTQHHKRVAFRVMCQSMHSRKEYVTPKWVFDAGVPGYPHVAINGHTQIDPAFWNDRYLELQCEFIAKLGEYLDGKPGLEFVDIGSIGQWGEMHLMLWTPEQLRDSGFSETRYNQAYRRCIDAHVRAFPNTQVFLNVGGQSHQSINDYAALRGVHFRQDGLKPGGASYNCGEWLYQPYSRRGVVCNFEFHSSWDGMVRQNWDHKQTIEDGLAAPISYLNTNLFGGSSYRQAPPEAIALLTDAAKRLGYRFQIPQMETAPEVSLAPGLPSRIRVATTWLNAGVAPCYDSFAIDWMLLDAAGEPVATERSFPIVPTTTWWQQEPVVEHSLLRVPAGTAPGQYRLAVRMLLPETDQTIELDLADRDAAGRCLLAPVSLVPGDVVQPIVFEEGFEGDLPACGHGAQVTAEVAAGGHTGERSLRVAGSEQKGWNYASHRIPQPLLPGALYKLTIWMRVDSTDAPPRLGPYVKLGVNDAEGKWIDNFSTGRYDLTKLGTWQELTGFVEVPVNGATADLAVEKGDNFTSVTIDLRLDEVRLELVEG